MNKIIVFSFAVILWSGCKTPDPVVEPDLVFKLQFSPDQARLNNLGAPADIVAGHAAQTPDFNKMSLHYIELAPGALTQLGDGEVVYKAEETNINNVNAIDFEKAVVAGNGEEFCKVKLKNIKPGTYEYIRASVSFQNYDVKYNINDIPGVGDLKQQVGTIASFVGYKTYIKNVTPRKLTLTVNGNMPQGYWVFETNLLPPYDIGNQLYFGQAPAGATTVVNPIAASSPIPAGSCVVTGKLDQPLVVTGSEQGDVTVLLSFSINHSFEWIDDNGNGQLDFYGSPGTPHEKVVDMGLRGLIPAVIK